MIPTKKKNKKTFGTFKNKEQKEMCAIVFFGGLAHAGIYSRDILNIYTYQHIYVYTY